MAAGMAARLSARAAKFKRFGDSLARGDRLSTGAMVLRNNPIPIRALGPLVLAGLVLAGCVSPARPAVRPVLQGTTPRSATFSAAGLEAVMGRSAGDLSRLFGAPRLDVLEGEARKLQFANGRCVLDAYLYPEGARRTPVVTYLDARRPDGAPVDRAACVEALRR